MITAVLFDIDGTLVDSVDLHAARAASRFTGTRRICWPTMKSHCWGKSPWCRAGGRDARYSREERTLPDLS